MPMLMPSFAQILDGSLPRNFCGRSIQWQCVHAPLPMQLLLGLLTAEAVQLQQQVQPLQDPTMKAC